MNAPIHYTIVPIDPAAHLFRVTCRVQSPDPAGQCLRMPAWIPGSYMIREFAKNIVELWAECDGKIVACEKIDKSTWRCEPVAGALTVTCDVYAWDLSVRAAHLDDTHGYFNGSSVFLAVVGQESEPCRVTISPPVFNADLDNLPAENASISDAKPGASFRNWRVATTLPLANGSSLWSFGDYRAANYDELIDHPVEMGTFTHARFEACGVPHDIVLTGLHRADMNRLCNDLKTICEAQIRFFGEPAPMDRYLFQVMVVGEGYGGLEHRASTSLIASRDDLPQVGEDAKIVKDPYRTFLGLCSHEYFHTWNVKRIKPAAFIPYELSQENYTRQLWIFEGFTSYYDDLMLVRCGLITPESYLELLGQNITRVLRAPGRHKQSVADSSFDAWTKYYRQDENAPNAIVSYYVKGSLIALALDLELRRRTAGKRSLDDVMRLLWQRHGLTGIGVDEDCVRRISEEVLGDDLADFFSHAVDGTEDLPLAQLLRDFAIDYHQRAADNQADTGGKPGRGERERISLGMRTQADALGARIQHCFENGAAMLAGLSAGDVVIAVDGLRVTHANVEKLLAVYRPNDVMRVHAFRRDELREFSVCASAAPADTCYLTFVAGERPVMTMSWLRGQTT